MIRINRRIFSRLVLKQYSSTETASGNISCWSSQADKKGSWKDLVAEQKKSSYASIMLLRTKFQVQSVLLKAEIQGQASEEDIE